MALASATLKESIDFCLTMPTRTLPQLTELAGVFLLVFRITIQIPTGWEQKAQIWGVWPNLKGWCLIGCSVNNTPVARHMPDGHRCDLLPSGSAWSRPAFLCLVSVASLHFPHGIFNLVLSHSTYGADLCGSNETLLTLLGFIVIQVMRWGGLGQTVTSSSSFQVIFTLRLRSQLGHLSCTTCKADTRCPTPHPSFFWLSIFLLLPLSREEFNQPGIPGWCT